MRKLFLVISFIFSLFIAVAPANQVQAGECLNVNGNGMCSCSPSGASCSGPWIVSYTCDGRTNECLQNEGGWSQGSKSTGNPGCGKTVQLDVFDRKCRLDGWQWDPACQFQSHAVWYSGDCSTPNPTPTPTPTPDPCTDTKVELRRTGEGSYQGITAFNQSTNVVQGDSIDVRCSYRRNGNWVDVLTRIGANLISKMAVVIPDGTRTFPSKPPLLDYNLEDSGSYRFVCRFPNDDIFCNSRIDLAVDEPALVSCGQTCGVVDGEQQGQCPQNNTCVDNTCVLNTCYANPESCLPNGCEPISTTECGQECGPSIASCPQNHTCDDGTCVLNQCLSETTTCSSDDCSVLPVNECGQSCGPDTAICPLDHTCQEGSCVLDTCLDNPSQCQENQCSLKPLVLQCVDIQSSSSDIKYGEEYSFSCNEVPDAAKYEFRALYTTSKDSLASAEVSTIATTQGNQSDSFSVEKVGRYVFQCRPCLQNDVCTQWGSANQIIQPRDNDGNLISTQEGDLQ